MERMDVEMRIAAANRVGNVTIYCGCCKGSGLLEDADCIGCSGGGFVVVCLSDSGKVIECPRCNGFGRYNDQDYCLYCSSTGWAGLERVPASSTTVNRPPRAARIRAKLPPA